MALRNLLIRVGADLSGLQRGMQQANRQLTDFRGKVSRTVKGIGATLATLGAGITLGSAIKDAMQFEANMQQVNRLMADSSGEFMSWADTTAQAFGYSRAEAVKFGATYGNLFTIFTKSAQETSERVTKFMETQAIISAATGRSMEDVGERLRSGMLGNTESIEDLGVNVQVNAIKMTKAFQDFANGQSWEQLNEQTKQTIRYFAILEQSAKKYGTEVADNTGARMGSFVASLNNVKLALGQAFLPALNVALPILTALANKVATVMGYVAQFSAALFGKAGAINQQTKAYDYQANAVSGVGDALAKTGAASKKAAKDAKGSVAAFDEINSLAEKSDAAGGESGDGGAGGGATIPMPTPDTRETESGFVKIKKSIQDLADKVKDFLTPAIETFKKAWGAVSDFFKEKVKGMTEFWKENGAMITQAFKNIWTAIQPVIAFVVTFIWESIKGLVNGVIQAFQGLIKFIGGVFTGDWSKAWEGLKDLFIGAVKAIWNFFNLTFVGGIKKALVEIVENGAKAFLKFADDFKKPLENVLPGILNFFKNTWNNIRLMITDFGLFWDRLIFNLGLKWYEFSTRLGNVGKEAWEGIKGSFSGAAEWFARTVITPIVNKFESIKDAFKDGFADGIRAVINTWIDFLNEPIKILKNFSVAGNKPFSGLPLINRIPALAKGGITNGPTLALIGDNPGGQEVVSPLDKLQDIIAGAVGTAVMSAMQLSNNSSRGGDVILKIDGSTIARVMGPYLSNEETRIGPTMIKTT
jgi:phage-related protein